MGLTAGNGEKEEGKKRKELGSKEKGKKKKQGTGLWKNTRV